MQNLRWRNLENKLNPMSLTYTSFQDLGRHEVSESHRFQAVERGEVSVVCEGGLTRKIPGSK